MASRNKKSSQSPISKTTKKRNSPEAKKPASPTNQPPELTIVGIGASAGGLDALRSFFMTLPLDTGMAFVVVSHLHPEHESHLAELLQRHTRMPTMQVTKRTKVEANTVYVIPPNRSILMTDTHLDTRMFDEPHGRRTPIDHFFRSMAASGHSDLIAIILSGGGTDGSVGIKDVKEVGGLIMVQLPEDAEYDSMPRAALSTGLVDVILPAAQLAEKLADYIQRRPQLPHDPGQLNDAELEILQRILAQVHARTGHDFSQYKRSTILRRVERRMQLNGFLTLEAYLAFLRGNANEAQAMFNDILIGVTNFFRDGESWEMLRQKVIPELFQNSEDGASDGIRVWSIGCATGEEAFGLAILLLEEAARRDFHSRIQVFASDLDDRSIALGREGLYPAAIEADVSPERLERFFTREGDYYRIKRELRDAVLFTSHNVLRDPPFSRQNLIACRNVLIYLQRSVQDYVFNIFHYSLVSGGYLFLGTSESAEHLPEMFEIVDKKHRLYQSRLLPGERRYLPPLPLTMRRHLPRGESNTRTRPPKAHFTEESTFSEEQHQRALESYGPPSVIVNQKYVVLHVSDTAGRYLHQPKGPIARDLLTIVRPELQLELRTSLFHAFEKGKATVSHPVIVQFNGYKRRVFVSVRPQPEDPGFIDRQAIVLFIEDEAVDPDETPEERLAPLTQSERDQLVTQLQSEVHRLSEQLQITVEEYESSNEEMKAANEELQSINEEYRSATEELETSKEELQSVNEELQTVNNEMRNKLEEISRAHQELENLMGATEIATLFLDRNMRIQRFSAGVQGLFSMREMDRGRHIGDLTHRLGYDEFVADAEKALRKLMTVEREIQTQDGKWWMIRLRPYRTVEDKIEGVVITFIDISELKEAERELILAKDSLEERVQERTRELNEANKKISQVRDLFFRLFYSNPIPTSLTQMTDGRFIDVNDAYLEFAGLKREDVIGHTSLELNLPLAKEIRPQIIEKLQKENILTNIELQARRASGEIATVLASIQLIMIDQTKALLMSFIDISERVKAEQQIHNLAYELTKAEQAERQRISRILHDDLQQRIFAAKVQTISLDKAYRQGDLESAQSDLNQIQNYLDESISMTRNLSIDLSPAVLQGESLSDALIWLARQMQEYYGLEVSIQKNDVSTNFEDALRILLFQAVREVLFNVVKHAETLHAAVTLEKTGGHIQLSIRDGGVGFQPDSLDKENDTGGLTHIQRRLNLMGCNLDVQSQPGNGTQVIIKIPSKLVTS